MQIIRDDKKLSRLSTITKLINGVGLAVLLIGMVLSYTNVQTLFWVQWVALLLGVILWQVGLNMGYRYTRKPRPDQFLDNNLKAAVQKSTLYHYVLPANHVLLTRSGPIVFMPYMNSGKIAPSDDGEKWRWQAPLWKRIMGVEPRLGNPTYTAEQELANLIAFINERAPEMDELSIGGIITFTNPAVTLLNLDASPIPAMVVTDLKKFVRKNSGRSLPPEQYKKLKQIFDDEAAEKGIDLS